ncbi:unnamed protein product, partial [Didymodactylos carnosus]
RTTSTSTTSSTSSTTSTSVSTTTATTATTTTPSCGVGFFSGAILSLNVGNAPFGDYTNYTFSYIATGTTTTLQFIFHGGGPLYKWWLDSVSVKKLNTSTEMLVNGGFETGDLTGWTQFCYLNCSFWFGIITNQGCAQGTYCYMDYCTAYDYLVQTFATTIGTTYILKFLLCEDPTSQGLGTAGSGTAVAYVKIN